MGLSNWLEIAKLVAPIVVGLVSPKLAPIASHITDGITDAEQLNNAQGVDKLQYVQKVASDAAAAVNGATGKTVVDTSNLDQAVQEAVDTAVAVTNLVHTKVSVPAPVPTVK